MSSDLERKKSGSPVETVAVKSHQGNSAPPPVSVSGEPEVEVEDEPSTEAPRSEVEAQPKDQQPREPFTVFAGFDRYAIVFMASLASLYSPLTAQIYFPAIPVMASAFHKSTEDINVTVTAYMVLQGLAPSLFGSIADRKGRRPLFILCIILLMATTTGIALTPTNAYWLLVVLRCIQAGGSASTVALSAGVISDIIPTQERGGYMGFVNIGASLGPCLGPVIGGVLVDKLGWRSIFWFIVIAAGACLILIILFLPETLRSMVGNGSIPAPRWDRALIPVIGSRIRSASSTRPPPRPVPNPFLLFANPDLILILLSIGIVSAAFYSVTATLSSLFSQHYPFLSETEIGLCFLAAGGGGVFGTIFQGKLLDWQFRRVKKKWEQEKATRKGESEAEKQVNAKSHDVHDEDFPIEEATMKSQIICVIIFSASLVGYGWSIDRQANIAVPLVMQFITGFAPIAIMTNTQVLIVDLFPNQGASVSAANNLVRCLLGAIAVSLINVITNNIGPGWTYTLGGAITMLTIPMTLMVMKIGPQWRRKRSEKARAKEESAQRR